MVAPPSTTMKKLILLGCAVLLGACNNLGLEEDRTDCDIVDAAVRFSYAFDGQYEEDLRGKVGDVRMFVFDSLNVLVTEVVVTKEEFDSGQVNVDLREGKYTFVVWAASGGDINDGGYDIKATEGETRLEDLQLHMADPESEFDDLYYAFAEDVDIVRGVPLVIPLEFIRQNNLVRVMVDGIDYAATRATDAPLNVYVSGRNGRFDYTGRLTDDASIQEFSTTEYSEADGVGTFDIRTLRIDMDYHTENPMTLHVETRRGAEVIAPMDIVATLLQSPDYNTQEDFDRIYEHPIELRIDPVTLDVTVWVGDYQLIPVTSPPLVPLNPVE